MTVAEMIEKLKEMPQDAALGAFGYNGKPFMPNTVMLERPCMGIPGDVAIVWLSSRVEAPESR